jgi:hypothetical protein
MSESISVPVNGSKEEIYRALLPQIEAVISGTDDLIANLANVATILKEAFNFHWVGFYRTTAPKLLTLGPFQVSRATRLCAHSFRKRRMRHFRSHPKDCSCAGCRTTTTCEPSTSMSWMVKWRSGKPCRRGNIMALKPSGPVPAGPVKFGETSRSATDRRSALTIPWSGSARRMRRARALQRRPGS